MAVEMDGSKLLLATGTCSAESCVAVLAGHLRTIECGSGFM